MDAYTELTRRYKEGEEERNFPDKVRGSLNAACKAATQPNVPAMTHTPAHLLLCSMCTAKGQGPRLQQVCRPQLKPGTRLKDREQC